MKRIPGFKVLRTPYGRVLQSKNGLYFVIGEGDCWRALQLKTDTTIRPRPIALPVRDGGDFGHIDFESRAALYQEIKRREEGDRG